MPKRNDRDRVYVLCKARPGSTETIAYGFNSGADEAARTALGQVAVTTAPSGKTIVFGANRPKPGRMSKTTATKTESSFVADASVADAKAAGWQSIASPKLVSPAKSAKMTLVKVTTSGINYAWMMNTADFEAFGAELGITKVDANDEVIIGCSSPKPAKAVKTVTGGTSERSRTTGSFIGDGVELPEGWRTTKAKVAPKA